MVFLYVFGKFILTKTTQNKLEHANPYRIHHTTDVGHHVEVRGHRDGEVTGQTVALHPGLAQ